MSFILYPFVRKAMTIGLLSLFCFGFGSCSHQEEGNAVKISVDSFSQNYFNWKFQQAMPYVTHSSHQWLYYAASQVEQADVDRLRSMVRGAECQLVDVEENPEDSTAISHVEVNGFLCMDTVGKTAHLVDKATYELKLRFQNGKWLVELEGLPKRVK